MPVPIVTSASKAAEKNPKSQIGTVDASASPKLASNGVVDTSAEQDFSEILKKIPLSALEKELFERNFSRPALTGNRPPRYPLGSLNENAVFEMPDIGIRGRVVGRCGADVVVEYTRYGGKTERQAWSAASPVSLPPRYESYSPPISVPTPSLVTDTPNKVYIPTARRQLASPTKTTSATTVQVPAGTVKLRSRGQSVICVETGEVFSSAKDIADKVGVSVGTVHQSIRKGCACRGHHYKLA